MSATLTPPRPESRSQHQPPPPAPPPPPPPAAPLVPASVEPSRLRQSFMLVARFALAVACVAISFQIDGGIFGGVLALFLLLLPFEKLYPRKKGQKLRRPMLGTDITFALMGPLLNIVSLIAIVFIAGISLFWIPGLMVRPLVSMLPAYAIPFVAFVMFDFLAYWAHRWAHEVPFLWRFHAVHHSPEHMDWISGFRIHPFDGVLLAAPAAFLLGAGIDGEVTGLLAVLQIVFGIFFHANVRVRWRFSDKLIANPEFHHWHHANESDSIGHNYAPFLPQWDLLFGTFFMPSRQSDRRPTHYGLDEYMPRHVFGMLAYPLRGARKHVSLLWHPIRAIKTGWRGTKNILRGVRQSTFRKTHSARRQSTIGCATTNGPLFEGLAEPPGVDPAHPTPDYSSPVVSGTVVEF